MDKITEFYKSHPQSAGLAVIDVWRRIARDVPPAKETDGEVYTNPHGFLDGTWWAQGGEAEDRGFLEGYLLCLRECVPQPTETYSRSVSYYWDKIWDYIDTHQKTAYDEAIADILFRFRDRAKR
jgi:hypothetical protein